MGLRKGLRLVRGMRRSLTEDEQHKIAGAIVEHLEGRAGADARGTWSAPPSEGAVTFAAARRSSRASGAPRAIIWSERPAPEHRATARGSGRRVRGFGSRAQKARLLFWPTFRQFQNLA
jgi:hypothetical protein